MAEDRNGTVFCQDVSDDPPEVASNQQHENNSEDSDNLDSEKLHKFITRALSESLRMSREAEGSREKKDRMLAKFSKERMSQLSCKSQSRRSDAPEHPQ